MGTSGASPSGNRMVMDGPEQADGATQGRASPTVRACERGSSVNLSQRKLDPVLSTVSPAGNNICTDSSA
eukprot:CAMPEP_0194555742 /NCGR_PEP_ID=MMETSP0253-20130528/98395_1 /TAXON_ID=2966 /ORGANISM="Noctiluca scintillans" /LENGTH=69 /DNA_ID=CAMNT_0039403241 /DNA_START=182 /DNA_END=391 /DNA_ORIENTATION=-